MSDRCSTCDRPIATDEQWKTIQPGEGDHLCWGESQCRDNAVDWRARYYAASSPRWTDRPFTPERLQELIEEVDGVTIKDESAFTLAVAISEAFEKTSVAVAGERVVAGGDRSTGATQTGPSESGRAPEPDPSSPTVPEQGAEVGPVSPVAAAVLGEREPPRPLRLAWNGAEWVDSRCGCRYHPDDDNMSHGGAPHVHRCERHAEVLREHTGTAIDLRACARAWAPEARLVGNVKASDVAALCDAYLTSVAVTGEQDARSESSSTGVGGLLSASRCRSTSAEAPVSPVTAAVLVQEHLDDNANAFADHARLSSAAAVLGERPPLRVTAEGYDTLYTTVAPERDRTKPPPGWRDSADGLTYREASVVMRIARAWAIFDAEHSFAAVRVPPQSEPAGLRCRDGAHFGELRNGRCGECGANMMAPQSEPAEPCKHPYVCIVDTPQRKAGQCRDCGQVLGDIAARLAALAAEPTECNCGFRPNHDREHNPACPARDVDAARPWTREDELDMRHAMAAPTSEPLCPTCRGEGKVYIGEDDSEECEDCDGSGGAAPASEPTDDKDTPAPWWAVAEMARLRNRIAELVHTAPTSEPTEDRCEPPDGYEVIGSHGCLNWSMKAKFPRPIDLARAEAVAACWAHHDRITAPLRARLAEVERERDHWRGMGSDYRRRIDTAHAQNESIQEQLATSRAERDSIGNAATRLSKELAAETARRTQAERLLVEVVEMIRSLPMDHATRAKLLDHIRWATPESPTKEEPDV